MRVLVALIGAGAALGLGGASGCGDSAESGPGDEPGETLGEGREPASTPTTCVTVRRGQGKAFDAMISSEKAANNYGPSTVDLLGAGSGGVDHFQALFRFDLTGIPVNATITSANLALSQTSSGVGTWNAHLVTAPWDEGTVTFQSFGGAFDPAIFKSGTTANASIVFSVLPQVQAWVSGALPNHGILLEEPGAFQTKIKAQEWAVAGARPTLTVCYKVNCAPGFADCNGAAADGCEADLGSPLSCGACGNVCSFPHAEAGCSAGSCTFVGCDPGFGNCDGSAQNGCETDLATSSDCGACGVTCSLPGASSSCATGSCKIVSCNQGSFDCDGNPKNGCEPTPCADGSHCAQGAGCASHVCAGGICAPPACNDHVQNGDETGVDCGGSCAVPEVCDGIDNDCDGLVDEGLGVITCGEGACAVSVPACANGQPGVCDPHASDGLSCNDDHACTGNDACQGGACAGAPLVGPVCRASTGPCDPAEACDGIALDCPADALSPAGALCRAPAGACDAAETCTGASAACPADVLSPAGTTCRAAANECDVAESCTGASSACPGDGVKAAGTACADDGNACTADACNGTSGAPACAHAAKLGCSSGAAGSSCRAILNAGASTGNGVYWIDPDGAGPIAAAQMYCDMSRHGGGWMLVGAIGESATATSAFDSDVSTGSLLSPVPGSGTYAHVNLARFNAYGSAWTVRSATDVSNNQSTFQYAFFRPKDGVSISPGTAGQNWNGTNTYTQLQVLTMTTSTGLSNTTWIAVDSCSGGHCGFAVNLFTSRRPDLGGPCLGANGQTANCHAIQGGVSGQGGTMTAAFGMQDGVGHSWSHKGTYWLRDTANAGTP
ncbi:MAG: DNRLRE domain-containing protein [Byssovorax sp.]